MPLDGVRHEGDVVLRFDVPGIDPDSIEVTVDRGVLSVSATRNEERNEDDSEFFVRERPMGTFTRRVRLSENLNADAVEADLPQRRPRGPDSGPGAAEAAQG